MLNVFVVLFAALLLVGCGATPIKSSGSLFARGVVLVEDGHFYLQKCYSSERIQIHDIENHLTDWFRNVPLALDRAYVEMMLSPPAKAEQAWPLNGLRMIGPQPTGCEFELNGNRYRAAGRSPLWIADVRAEGVRVNITGSLRQLTFPAVEAEVLDNGLRWRSELKVQRGYRLELTLNNEVCIGQFGTRYPYKAVLVINERTFEGCGRDGDLGQQAVVGRYSYDDDMLSLRVELNADGSLMLADGRRGETSAVVNHLKGRWVLASDRRVRVEVVRDNGVRRIMHFDRMADGSLKLTTAQHPYRSGLRLVPEQK